jgi:cytochrome P450
VTATEEPRAYPFNEPRGLEMAPLYAELRKREPLARVRLAYGEDAWLVTRYADVRTVLTDPRFGRAASLERDEPRTGPEGTGQGLLAMDPPEHTRLRTAVARAFTARRIEPLRPRVQRITDDLLDTIAGMAPPVDLLEHFALRLSVATICELLGVSAADHERIRVWADAMLSTSALPAELKTECAGAVYGYMMGLVHQRRQEPTDDLLGTLVQARDEQEHLSDDELIWMAIGLLIAGNENTALQLCDSVYVLLRNPAEPARLRARPDLIPHAVDELLRYVPLQVAGAFPRYASEDVELGGGVVRKGEPVIADLMSANWDEDVFDCPERLDFARGANPHLAFGHGPHHCVGAPLARLELQVALSALLRRFPDLRLAVSGDELKWNSGRLFRGPVELPVTW